MTAAMIRGLRFALRSNRRNKLFALTAAIAFSFGIGATATVFSAVDAVLLRPATFADAGSMVVVEAAHKNEEWDNVSPAIYSAIRARANLFARVAGERTAIFTVTRVQAPDQVFGLSVSGNFFSLLAAHPLLGRLLTAEDDRAGAMPVVLLSYRAWRKLFGGDPKVVGRSAVIDGEVHTVIGVMPDHFVLPDPNAGSLLWTTLRLTNAELTSPEARGVRLFARRRASAPLSVVQRQLNALAAAEQPDSRGPLRLRVSALRDETDPTRKLTLWLAMGMVCGLLLIGCANLASLLLARAIGRRRDYAIRVATGASRRQLIGE